MRLAVWQGASPAGNPEAAFAALDTALHAAGAAGAAMLVAPEAYLPGYNQRDIAAQAQMQSGAWVARLSALAAKAHCGLVTGYAERGGDHVYNAAVAIGPDGAILAHYRKIQLYGPRENAIYSPGDAYTLFDVAGTKATVLICYDIEFAPHVAALAARGATLFLVPTANMAPFTHVVRATVPAMAANHGVTIAYANYCGTEGDLTYVGGSLIAGPHGEVLAQAGEGPALLIVDVPDADPTRLSTQSADFRKV
jgi:5-aminopentanamidase